MAVARDRAFVPAYGVVCIAVLLCMHFPDIVAVGYHPGLGNFVGKPASGDTVPDTHILAVCTCMNMLCGHCFYSRDTHA